MCSFFRNPRRRIPDGEGLILAPADGRIVVVKKGQRDKVSIFMSVSTAREPRPAAGRITEIRYQPGKFMRRARGGIAPERAERPPIARRQRLSMRFVQVAGILARRIVCYVHSGDQVQRGEIFGTILFGSRWIFTYPAVSPSGSEG